MGARTVVGGMATATAAVLAVGGLSGFTTVARPGVRLVGSFNGRAGQYRTIQAAIDAAKPGDYVLVGPGDYHEIADETGAVTDPAHGRMGGVYIAKSGITLRGMDRNSVIVDGTNPGAAPCSSAPSSQNMGALGVDGKPVGRNGILVWKADDVSVANLTVCNFLAGTGASGNQVWWNGGDGSGTIGLTGYWGSYLTTTSTYFRDEATAAEYGIFASNSAGPAGLSQMYANNMNDSGTYVGACLRRCDVTLDQLWMQYNALGYSGTNSGGRIVIEHSQFDHNEDGLDTNTAISGDPPAPQDGACPGGGTSPLTGTTSCWVVLDNNIHDNNNPNTPRAGSAAAGPVGTGMTVSGGRDDTLLGNTITHNGAWGVLFVPYAQSGTPSLGQSCTGKGGHEIPGFGCVLDPWNDALTGNTFSDNGFFHNPTNSDFGQITFFGGEPSDCFSGNTAPDGSAPADLQTTQPRCGKLTTGGNLGGALLGQVLCDTGIGGCPTGAHYPTPTKVALHAVPTGLPTMANPCAGVPANAWCPAGTPVSPSAPTTSHPAHTATTAAGSAQWRRSPVTGRLIG